MSHRLTRMVANEKMFYSCEIDKISVSQYRKVSLTGRAN